MKTCFILKFTFKKGKETVFYQADFIVLKLSRLLDLKIVISRMNLEKFQKGQYRTNYNSIKGQNKARVEKCMHVRSFWNAKNDFVYTFTMDVLRGVLLRHKFLNIVAICDIIKG